MTIAIIMILKKYNSLTKELNLLQKDHYNLNIEFNTIKQQTESFYKAQFESWKILEGKKIRKDSVARSRSVMRGQATEHLAPLMIDNLNLKDFRFLGNPIDYIVFNGSSAVADKEADTVESIIFIDIKTGTSRLTKVQRRIRDCIKNGNVEFIVYNPDKKK